MTIDYSKRRGVFCAGIGRGEAICSLPIGHESDHYCCGLHPSWPYDPSDTEADRARGEAE